MPNTVTILRAIMLAFVQVAGGAVGDFAVDEFFGDGAAERRP